MTFTPSDKFNERWLDSPVAMRQAIFDELSDIKTLLNGDVNANEFKFKHPDLHSKLSHLQTAHLQTLKQVAQKLRQERADALLPILEQKIEQKLKDKVNERLVGLDNELKLWIRQIIQDELSKEVKIS